MAGPSSSVIEAVSLDIELPKRDLIKFQRELGKLPEKVKSRISRDIRKELMGPASNIVSDFPPDAPLSGMIPRWGRVNAKIRVYPMSDEGKAIAVIGIAGEDRGFNRTLAIIERAGSRSGGLTPWGRTMTKWLQERYPLVGKGGRFIWKSWLKHRPEAIRGVVSVINRFVSDYNRQVK